ncbi:MAG: hypothetical protein RBS88_08695, partial [Spongiibacteraceae bacterium]|nr:hypothetical protein [Spongiibacteraceae bacterium]
MSWLRILVVGLLVPVFLAGCEDESSSPATPVESLPPVTTTPPPAPTPVPPAPSEPAPAPVQPVPETPVAPDQPTTEPEDEAPVNTTVTLKWTAPSSRENGTPLLASEIKGYEIYYCKDDCEPEGSGTTVAVPGSPTSYDGTLDEVGTWHFAV